MYTVSGSGSNAESVHTGASQQVYMVIPDAWKIVVEKRPVSFSERTKVTWIY